MAEFTFEIEEHLLTLSENEKGWTKEINRVSFNGAPAKFDIRAWSPDHTNSEKLFEIKKNADKSTFSNCIFFMKILTFVCLATKRLPINLNYF